jgi:heme/copper-type cytochrome/quinol oxidase subunit 2
LPEPSGRVPRSHLGVELVWAVLPAIGLAVLLAFTWRAIRAVERAPAGAVRVAELS